MNKFLKILSVFLFSISIHAQGIKFFHGSFEEAMEYAQKNNKKIFVDVYTTWCGPCKKMSQTTFVDPQVGDYFNKGYVCLKIDAENESKSGFFKRYKVTAFPSLFWLEANGDLLDKFSGFLDATSFLDFAKKAEHNDILAQYNKLDTQWKSGDHSFELYNKFVLGLMNKLYPEKIKPYTIEYISGLSEKELQSPNAFRVLANFIGRAEKDVISETLLKNWDIYLAELPSTRRVWTQMYSSMVRQATALRVKKDEVGYKKLIDFIQNSAFNHKDLIMDSMKFENLVFDKKYSEAINEMIALTQKYKDQPFLYDEYIYTLIIGDYYLQKDIKLEDADKVIAFATTNAKNLATQKSMLYLASAYTLKKDYKTAYEYLASLAFYPEPKLSNAVYKKMNLPVTKKEFPW